MLNFMNFELLIMSLASTLMVNSCQDCRNRVFPMIWAAVESVLMYLRTEHFSLCESGDEVIGAVVDFHAPSLLSIVLRLLIQINLLSHWTRENRISGRPAAVVWAIARLGAEVKRPRPLSGHSPYT
jgi:hypothetical protein